MRMSPVPSTPGSSRRRTEAFLTASLLESGNGRHSRSPSHPPPMSPINHLRPGLLGSPNRLPRSPNNPATHKPAAAISPPRRPKVLTPITTLRNPPRSPAHRRPIKLVPSESQSWSHFTRGQSTEICDHPRATGAVREQPRTLRVSVNPELHSQTHGEA
jgi:hypothetical protein